MDDNEPSKMDHSSRLQTAQAAVLLVLICLALGAAFLTGVR